MWAPDSLDELWFHITEPLTACGLKVDRYLEGSIEDTYHSTVSLYALMKDPQRYFNQKRHILKYLDESQVFLLCLMTAMGDWDSQG